MRLAPWMTLAALVLGPWSVAVGRDSPFKHDWRFEKGGTLLISKHPAPFPFSTSGEPEATLEMSAARLPAGSTPSLQEVVENEIRGIRKEVELAEYLEEDGRTPDRDITSWFQDVAGQKVGFIKYRAAGTTTRHLATPQTWIHAIAVKDGYVVYCHLMVRYGGHQEEVRADQIRLIEEILPHFPARGRK